MNQRTPIRHRETSFERSLKTREPTEDDIKRQRAREEKIQLFRAVFETTAGNAVLDEIRSVANITKIDADNPNPNAAIYRAAQLALVKYIENLIKGDRHDN